MFKQSCSRMFQATMAVVWIGAMTHVAQGQCRPSPISPKPSAWRFAVPGAFLENAGLQMEEHRGQNTPTIVGMWHVTFTAKTMNGSAIPDTVIDSALVVWHQDGTEIMNSGRPPQDGNFCLGVWEETAPRSYQLNHFAWGANAYAPGTANGIVGAPIGPVHYREAVTLGPAGNHYSGSFSLDQYDSAGNVAVSFTGTLKATRITVDTTVQDLL